MKNNGRLLTLLRLITITSTLGAAGIFTIVPKTQYVYLNHNVTFECATNLTGYTLTFSYGGSIHSTLKQTNLPDGGIKITTTFIATNGNNGTSVSCIARLNNVFKGISDLSYVYVQGPPGTVSNLQGYQLDHCCIVFSWSPPFTLGQLSVWYQVILSVGEEVMSSEVIYTTNYTYCPIDLTNGEYRLNITIINGAGTGIWNSNTTMFKTDKTLGVVYNNYFTYRQDNDWTYHFETPSTQLCTQPIINTTVMSCNLKNSSDCYNSTNVTIITDSNGYKTIISVIDLPPRKKFNTFVYLQYKSGQIFQTTPVVTSSHDLQQLIITNTSNDILCLQFGFVNGCTINKVHLHLQCGHRLHPFDNKDLSRNDQFNFNKCVGGIPANNWTLYACDGVLPNDSDICFNPAVILTNISITGVPIEPFRSSIMISSTSSSFNTRMFSSFESDILVIMSTSTPTKQNKRTTLQAIGIAVGVVVIIILVVAVIGMLSLLYCFFLQKKKNLTDRVANNIDVTSEKSTTVVRRNRINSTTSHINSTIPLINDFTNSKNLEDIYEMNINEDMQEIPETPTTGQDVPQQLHL